MGDSALPHACTCLGPLATALADDQERVLWMPAHCSDASIGGKRLSNGLPLQTKDVAGNAYVDELAKRAA